MKELSIEEKAKAYDEAYKKVAVRFGSNVADEIFLKESEGEKIRKEIISTLKYANYKGVYDKHLAWLEKQGEQKEFTDYKEAVMDIVRHYIIPDDIDVELRQIASDEWKLVKWGEEDFNNLKGAISLLAHPTAVCTESNDKIRFKIIDWLKSLRPQNRWKPSDKQMQALSDAGNSFRPFEEGHKILWSLYNDLKKLKA